MSHPVANIPGEPPEKPVMRAAEDGLIDDKNDIEVLQHKSVDPPNTGLANDDSPPEDPELAGIPLIVREMVDFEDDPTLPTLTFRYFVMSTFFVAIGAFVSQMSWFRTTSAPFSILFVQLAAQWVGIWLARILPAKDVGFGRWKFSLNPGPFNIKEHVLVTLAAGAGATSNLGEIIVSVKEIYYGETMNGWAAVFFMWACMWTGYSYSALARSFLIYDPTIIWPPSLQQVALFRAQSQRMSASSTNEKASKQMRVFWFLFCGIFLWQFLPAYAFPMLSSLAFICWCNSSNPVTSFVGSGLGGMGVLNFTLDWGNITSTIFTTPWYVQVILFAAFFVNTWVLVPIGYFGQKWNSDKYNIMSLKIFQQDGKPYPFNQLMTSNAQFNQTAYDEIGLVYMGAQSMWGIFFSYAAYASAFVWLGLFYGRTILATVKSVRNRTRLHHDKLANLMLSYKEVPLWWYGAIFVVAFVTNLVLVLKGGLYLPVWTYILALLIGAVTILPMGYVYGISGYQIPVGTFNELIYGYMIDAPGSSRHPIGSLVYRIISGQCWYRAQTIMQDQKIGHYMHIPPRAVLFSQLWGSLVGVPVNYATIRWILNTKMDYFTGKRVDPLHQWTGQNPQSYNNAAVQYGLVGPKRLFASPIYTPLLYGFLLGLLVPVVIYVLHRRFPGGRFNLANSTIFFSELTTFRGNVSTGPFTSIILGFISNFWLFRYRHQFWQTYAYISGAALDAGWNLNMLAIFIFFSAGKTVSMPAWWGNNADSVERCFGH